MITLRAGAAIHAGERILVPVERVRVEGRSGAGTLWVGASVGPVAVVVRAAGEAFALGVDGTHWSVDDLLDRVAGLAEKLDPQA